MFLVWWCWLLSVRSEKSESGSTRSVVWFILAPEKRAAISADFLRLMMFSWSLAEVTMGRCCCRWFAEPEEKCTLVNIENVTNLNSEPEAKHLYINLGKEKNTWVYLEFQFQKSDRDWVDCVKPISYILCFVKGRPTNIIERTYSIRECFIAKKESVPIVWHWKRYS